MAEKTASSKAKQLSLEEYKKIKDKIAKSKLKLKFPWIVKVCFAIPMAYCIFLICYFVFHVRFITQH